MITSPLPSVTPEQELARLTLISPGNEAAIRRRSVTAAQSQSLGDIDGAPILGPLGPPQLVTNDKTISLDNKMQEAPKVPDGSDGDSEKTLFSDNNGLDQLPPLCDDPDNDGYKTVTPMVKPEAPNRPPPVPPRPEWSINQEGDLRKQLIEEVEIGAQQDVTEVINNVLFQSQCAIKPRSVASDGEQVDQIKE